MANIKAPTKANAFVGKRGARKRANAFLFKKKSGAKLS